jgi:hypothetical protein
MKNHLLLLATISFLAAGCQSGPPMKQTPVDNGTFMRLWDTYSDCQNTADFEQLKQDTVVLSAAAKRSLSQDAFVLPLPEKLQQFVAMPPARLAVDLKAMSAACSLRAGQVAFETQRFDIARELLKGILEYHPQSEYTYYSLQAKAILLELEPSSVQVSLKLR